MKKPIFRILVSAIIFSFIGGIIVTIIGLILKWKTSAEFSNGYFYAGAILIMIGLLFIVGSQNERTVTGLQYNWSAVKMDISERFRLWESDLSSGYSKMAFFGISGLLLFGQSALALLVERMF
jgi:hypothetical protein